jgi:hypothetical protein
MERAERDNLEIKRIIEKGDLFFIGRIAGCELKVAYYYYYAANKLADIVSELLELENNAGIFTPTDESLAEYCKQLIQAYDHCTAIAEWDGKVFALTGEGQQFITKRTPSVPKLDARALEPYYFRDSWMPALKGKRILIVHPFSKTFQKQLPNLKTIFPGWPWFEECQLEFISPPLTLAGNHGNKSWSNHMDLFLESLAKTKEFDIALVAAGGYGMLISDYIFTKMGKSVMYIGGALQLFFGVIGKRWFDNKDILKLVNDDWIRPVANDKPANFIKVERGCYW